MADWYDAQQKFVNGLDLLSMTETPIYEETASFSKVHPYKRKELIKKDAIVRLYGDRITVDDHVFPFETDTVVILGKNKLNLYHEKDLFQLKGSARFNGLKYLNFYHRHKNQLGGQNGEFLGL